MIGRRAFAMAMLGLGLAAGCVGGAESGVSGDGAFVDISGARHTPLDPDPGELHCLVFVTVDCPIANGYAPTIQGLRRQFGPRPVRFFLVHVDPDVDSATAAAHAAEYGHEGPILRDPDHVLVRATGAGVTPEAAVVGASGEVLYCGRIDNWYADFGSKRPQPSQHDLRDALQAALAGQPIARDRVPAIGCYIDDLRR